ncbi:biotin transporter BioY [Natronocalculus amylovorans]|uniref:Biotin transporter BioY n=1 Tax=Natronocalculus amylovorans TaxID=2917812 RepID=A0AAE3FV89_9EURY|nr:biotin transporter BioY [Natronocalculus amylovorans]MCL9815851.1 biotin transporter BioY [Natronocalculus amylovorans]NUE01637.1 biotin transporter BioY [Halorubraceae archaeon YAN]
MATQTDSVDLVGDEVTANIARAALFAALMGGFAYVSFPNPLAVGVPVTLQVLGVFLAGIMLGPVWGAVAMILYLAAGAVGAPVFSGGAAGLGFLIGSPTLGYLWSYPIAAAVIGLVVHRGVDIRDYAAVSMPILVGAMVAGTTIIYAIGTIGFAVVQSVSLYEAFLISAVAFIPFEALKIAAAVGIIKSDAIAAA